MPPVAVYVVSDLHGASDALADALPDGAALLLLGDLINFLDYRTMTGILTEVFPAETVEEVVRLRTAGQTSEARAVMRNRSAGREDEVRGGIAERVRNEYEQVFARLPKGTRFILGNVDNPGVAREVAGGRPHVDDVDGTVVTIDGERIGFVGGALPTPLRVAGEVSVEDFRAKLDLLGAVDVVCTHIPPAVPELCYDTLAKKSERGSEDLLAYIRDVKPRRAYFGHVHQPLLSSLRIGPTECVNVGYFRRTRRAWPHLPEESTLS